MTVHSEEKKMTVNSTIGPEDPRFAAAAQLATAAGYEPPSEFSEIHCTPDKASWLENGFLQFFTTGEDRCRVLVYMPRQELQPHIHDITEDFKITYGWVDLFCDGSLCRLRLGETIHVESGVKHTLRAGRQGLVFEETVGEGAFAKRSTNFQPEVARLQPFSSATVLVTGASRGLGRGFVEALLAQGARVVATCRSPASAKLPAEALVVQLDVADEGSVGSLPQRLADLGVTAVDVLVNNAGISNPAHPVDPSPTCKVSDVRDVFETNVLGTLGVTQVLLPLLRAGDDRLIVNLSSQLASLTNAWSVQGRRGGCTSYRVSRAANNMLVRCLGGELLDDGFTVLAMSPGHVATDMGSAGGRTAPLTVEDSVAGMLRVLAAASPRDSGKFLQYDGQELPW